jgi:hypothetical protein
VGFSEALARWNPELGYRPFSHSPPTIRRPIRQNPMIATRGKLEIVDNLAIQPFGKGMAESLYPDRRMILNVMVSNAR